MFLLHLQEKSPCEQRKLAGCGGAYPQSEVLFIFHAQSHIWLKSLMCFRNSWTGSKAEAEEPVSCQAGETGLSPRGEPFAAQKSPAPLSSGGRASLRNASLTLTAPVNAPPRPPPAAVRTRPPHPGGTRPLQAERPHPRQTAPHRRPRSGAKIRHTLTRRGSFHARQRVHTVAEPLSLLKLRRLL